MPPRPDETAMYEAIVYSRSAGSARDQQGDRDRARLYVERLGRSGWVIVPVSEELKDGVPRWLERLRKVADEQGETIDTVVDAYLSDSHDPEACDERTRDLEELLERHDIEVPE